MAGRGSLVELLRSLSVARSLVRVVLSSKLQAMVEVMQVQQKKFGCPPGKKASGNWSLTKSIPILDIFNILLYSASSSSSENSASPLVSSSSNSPDASYPFL
ncbi:hypothetical protein OIU74_024585 [Salix koriyanagi]|uniref:Uncharacterized protein n=1 Tax=Salix koriyanagi TaxID=2511006 RepID=A0A9Q0W761_9ROSI|nr:hypothetical protein OIU74_024585 [Salix koriyanagi]